MHCWCSKPRFIADFFCPVMSLIQAAGRLILSLYLSNSVCYHLSYSNYLSLLHTLFHTHTKTRTHTFCSSLSFCLSLSHTLFFPSLFVRLFFSLSSIYRYSLFKKKSHSLCPSLSFSLFLSQTHVHSIFISLSLSLSLSNPPTNTCKHKQRLHTCNRVITYM